VRVEHVHINQGAQAVIGNVHPQNSGRAQSSHEITQENSQQLTRKGNGS
jgi:hypothetical protein